MLTVSVAIFSTMIVYLFFREASCCRPRMKFRGRPIHCIIYGATLNAPEKLPGPLARILYTVE